MQKPPAQVLLVLRGGPSTQRALEGPCVCPRGLNKPDLAVAGSNLPGKRVLRTSAKLSQAPPTTLVSVTRGACKPCPELRGGGGGLCFALSWGATPKNPQPYSSPSPNPRPLGRTSRPREDATQERAMKEGAQVSTRAPDPVPATICLICLICLGFRV